MNQPLSDDEVRALLATAKVDTPMPPDVVSRLDDVIAAHTRPAETGAPGEPVTRASPAGAGATVHPLRREPSASRKGGWSSKLLVAAAAVLVVGGGGIGLAQMLQSQGGGADSAPGGGATPPPNANQAPSAQPPKDDPSAPVTPVTMTRADFARQAPRAFAPERRATLGVPPTCAGPDQRGAKLLITLDGQRAVLIRRLSGDVATFTAWNCQGTAQLAKSQSPNQSGGGGR